MSSATILTSVTFDSLAIMHMVIVKIYAQLSLNIQHIDARILETCIYVYIY